MPLRLALLAGVLDTVANVATLLALQSSMLSLAGVLIALYPAATVLLAIVVLRERVTRWQALGMVLALASVAMIAGGLATVELSITTERGPVRRKEAGGNTGYRIRPRVCSSSRSRWWW